ncbi:MAG: LPS export ABC transporter periplasmic protein LptC [Deltaproteobacteria bacterium]|nr:LPS export ABC transporter periplasmic protein LptC [Deltaproteobacteria bacterium]
MSSILILTVFLKLKPDAVKETVLPAIARHLEFELNDAHYTHSKSGTKRWELTAAKAQRQKGSETIEMIDLAITLFADDGSLTTIVADQGAYTTNTGDIKLQKNIVITSPTYTITTDNLTYLDQQEKLIIKDRITVLRDGFALKAAGASMEVPKNIFHFTGGVSATIQRQKEQP